MAPETSLTVDLEKLLAPISADQPAGEWLRGDAVYDAIQDARTEEDPSLPRGVWQRELERADWGRVERLAAEALETRSKDLQLAAWLLEAWIHRHGFSGVEAGMRLLTALCESFWDDLWPPIEEDDLDYRLAPIHWINEKLYLSLKRIPITRPETAEDTRSHTWADWESAVRLARVSEADPEKARAAETRGSVTREKFLAGVTLTPTDFYQRTVQELDGAVEATTELGKVLDARCGADSPSLSQFRDTLRAIYHFVDGVLRERGPEEAGTGEEMPGGAVGAPPAEEASREAERAFASGPIRGRSDAYRRLAEAADYLLRTEPHSPTAYLVRRAVSWGNMTLAEVLAELLRDQADLTTVYQLLGIDDPRTTRR